VQLWQKHVQKMAKGSAQLGREAMGGNGILLENYAIKD